MRAALSTIQQTLTPEAAAVLSHSMAEAARRNHGQTTPLHVASTLLAAPSGYLRQACIRSHPNSSHPLQCRALELCFSVALERLPTAQAAAAPGAEPPISNALLAALKRAQAHQRRGCPEQQQQPLLAVKVELEQLIVSILDDPSVSRVMREASFSSPAVKATIEQSLSSSNAHHAAGAAANATFGSNFRGIGPRIFSNSPPIPSPTANRNIYLNPRLQQGVAGQIGNPKSEDLNILLEIIARGKKRNPIVVSDSEPESLLKEFFRKLENKELGILKNVQVVSMDQVLLSDKNQIEAKINDLGGLIAGKITNGGVVLDLGDLKWLVEKPASFGGVAVAEITKLLARFSDEGDACEGNKLWLIGRATRETYLRCQVYHSTMENDWDLQAVPIAPRKSLPGTFPRLGAERVLNNPIESLNPSLAVPSPLLGLTMRVSENLNPIQTPAICAQCSENYEKELAKITAIERSFSEVRQDSTLAALPPWLQNAKQNNPAAGMTNGSPGKKKQELQKKWRGTCLHLHPNFHQNGRADRADPPALSMASLRNPNLLSHPPFQPKLPMAKPLGGTLQLNMNPNVRQPAALVKSPPGSPVTTDLVLGRKECDTIPEKVAEDPAKDFLGCISSEVRVNTMDKFSNALDADAYKKLLKGLMEKVWWQAEAASAVASAVTRCRLGNGKRAGSRGDVWLLFTGPDRVGKKKMASVLAAQVCGASPVAICLGLQRDDEDSHVNFRGKTAVDRIAEAVRRNPFAVILLEDIDKADALVRGSIKQAIERGRLTDFYGREVGLGNAMFIVTGDWSTMSPEALRDEHFVDEKKLAAISSGGWQLRLIVREKSAKRRSNWLQDDDKPFKMRKEIQSGLSLDLNLAAACTKDDKTDGSHNSSDLTVDHEDNFSLVNRHFSITSVPHDLVTTFDDSILFKPVDSAFVRNEIKKTISVRFAITLDNDNVPIDVEDDVLEKILGGLWHDRISLEEWIEKAVAPSFDELKTRLASVRDRSNTVVCLVVESGSPYRWKSNGNREDWLPGSILV